MQRKVIEIACFIFIRLMFLLAALKRWGRRKKNQLNNKMIENRSPTSIRREKIHKGDFLFPSLSDLFPSCMWVAAGNDEKFVLPSGTVTQGACRAYNISLPSIENICTKQRLGLMPTALSRHNVLALLCNQEIWIYYLRNSPSICTGTLSLETGAPSSLSVPFLPHYIHAKLLPLRSLFAWNLPFGIQPIRL